jgi:hypothetical protein
MDNGGRYIRITRIFNAQNISAKICEFATKCASKIQGAEIKHFECNDHSRDDYTTARI